jgi:hypothetical protein
MLAPLEMFVFVYSLTGRATFKTASYRCPFKRHDKPLSRENIMPRLGVTFE